MAKPDKSAPLRRSTRINLRIPVTISGKLEDGNTFSEEAFIVTISKFGAKLVTQLPLKVGAQVTVQPRRRRETALFRVTWVGNEDTPRAGEIGIEYAEVSNLLGLHFPD